MSSVLVKGGWFVIPGLFFLVSCQSPSSPTAEGQLEKIEALEDSLRSKSSMDTALGNELVKQYDLFIEEFPKRDSLAPDFLLKMGVIQGATATSENYQDALASYERVVNEYPDHPAAPEALLNIAIIYERQKDRWKAQKAYQRFLKKYPDHTMASDVERLLKMVRMSPEEQEAQVQDWTKTSKNDSSSSRP